MYTRVVNYNCIDLLKYLLILYINMSTIVSNQKERSDMILEPLQVMVQLGILSHCPLGTKLSVYNNILHLQRPTVFQGAYRWWNEDKKDDLYYLFNAIKRFYQWYNWKENAVFKFILKKAKEGLDKLKRTYDQTNVNNSITQTLDLYKKLLDVESPNIFFKDLSNNINIDNVFKKIKGEYTKEILRVAYNSLLILDNTSDESEKQTYIDGFLMFFSPIHKKLRIWISENLTC